MYARQTTVVNRTGLHARPAAEFVIEAKKHPCRITVRRAAEGCAAVNAKSITRILAEGLSQGAQVEVAADGEGETEAVDSLIALIDGGFGEL
uniref:Phosphocarrier protein HPr n=1 Tax=uncultured bacterium contig00006 TaxID=1181498 RepID=A0A806JYK5_9BACT|nr:catabolite repression HPr-like protein Crh [uncultured bacterium contig00006]